MKEDHKFITLERIFKYGFINFGRNIWLAVAAMAMMTITLTILLFALVANATFNHTVSDLTSRIDVSFFMKDEVTPQQLDELMNKIKNADNVKSVTYIDKAEALKIYRQQNINDPALLTAISEIGNPLPASLSIKPKDVYRIQVIRDLISQPSIKSLETDKSKDSSKKREESINNITKATHFFQQAGIVGIAVFILISMLIIFNTIRMTIFNRRDELIIMRLLGAKPWFIKGPFVVETMLYGIVAALVSLGICAMLFKVASSTLQASTLGLLDISYSNQYFTRNLWIIMAIQIGSGILIGAASSAIATRRYLRLK